MNAEQEFTPLNPERRTESHESVFDLEQLPVEAAVMLHEMLQRAVDTYLGDDDWGKLRVAMELVTSYEHDLEVTLISRNLNKARELIRALAVSDDGGNRSIAGAALGVLLRREYELGNTEHAAEMVELWIPLLIDERSSESAGLALEQAVQGGWLPEGVVERLEASLPPI